MKKHELARAVKSALRTFEALDSLSRENPELESARESARQAMRALYHLQQAAEFATRKPSYPFDGWYTGSEWDEHCEAARDLG